MNQTGDDLLADSALPSDENLGFTARSVIDLFFDTANHSTDAYHRHWTCHLREVSSASQNSAQKGYLPGCAVVPGRRNDLFTTVCTTILLAQEAQVNVRVTFLPSNL